MKIKKQILNYIKKDFHKRGLMIDKLTKKKQLISFINSVKPYKVDKALIRIGPNSDGGYLIPDDLEGIEACFSAGVGQVSLFEKECANRGMKVFLADKSVQIPPDNHLNFDFIKKFIGPYSNDDFITMNDWVSSRLDNQNSDLLLQMDIEGAEYVSVLNMSDDLMDRFRIIIIEFHNLDKLWNHFYFNIISKTFEKLLRNHTCVHIHPNNCGNVERIDNVNVPELLEFTFFRNDRIESKYLQNSLPHSLDYDCLNPEKTGYLPIDLPRDWYGE
jgi:hypothetical protein